MFIVLVFILLGSGCFGADVLDMRQPAVALNMAKLDAQGVEQAIKLWRSIHGDVIFGSQSVVGEYNLVCSKLRELAKGCASLSLEDVECTVSEPVSCEFVPNFVKGAVCFSSVTTNLKVLQALDPLRTCQVEGFAQSCEHFAETIVQSVKGLFANSSILSSLVAASQYMGWECSASLARQIIALPSEVRQQLGLMCPRLKVLMNKGEQEHILQVTISLEPFAKLRPYMKGMSGPVALACNQLRASALSIVQQNSPEEQELLGPQQVERSVTGFLCALASFNDLMGNVDSFLLGVPQESLGGSFVQELLTVVGGQNLLETDSRLRSLKLASSDAVWDALQVITKIGLGVGVRDECSPEAWQFVKKALHDTLMYEVDGEDLLSYLRFVYGISGSYDLKSELIETLCDTLSGGLPNRCGGAVWRPDSKVKNITNNIGAIITFIDRMCICRSENVYCFFLQCLPLTQELSGEVLETLVYSTMLVEERALNVLEDMARMSYPTAKNYVYYLSGRFPVAFWWGSLFFKERYVARASILSHLIWAGIRVYPPNLENAVLCLKRFIVDADSSDSTFVEIDNICKYFKEGPFHARAREFVAGGWNACQKLGADIARRQQVARKHLASGGERGGLASAARMVWRHHGLGVDDFAYFWAKEKFE